MGHSLVPNLIFKSHCSVLQKTISIPGSYEDLFFIFPIGAYFKLWITRPLKPYRPWSLNFSKLKSAHHDSCPY